MRACLTLLFSLVPASLIGGGPEAIVVVVGDQHSAYERTAQWVARIDQLRAAEPAVPMAVLINGDALEYGNLVARRSAGAIDFAMFAALTHRVPTVLNLGNHEPEFYDLPETVRRLRAAGLIVISGNLRDRATGRPFAPPTTTLRLGGHELTVVGVATDRLATYRVAVRPQLDLADPEVWARQYFPRLLQIAQLPVVMSHAGLRADRAMLPLVPDGTLFAGAHDHLRFVHQSGATVYFHSGSWLAHFSLARLERTPSGLRWNVTQERLADTPADPALADLIRETLAQHLTAEETKVVGRSPRALAPAEAAALAVEAARAAARADAAMIGATTFGAGVPAGDVSRFAFDAWVRFDGPLFAAEVDGAWLQALMRRANQGPDTPFAERSGENLVAVAPGAIEAERRYRFVTTDWVAKNVKTYLGEHPPVLAEVPGLRLKDAVLTALRP